MSAPADPDPIARARRAVAHFSADAQECRAVMAMLGLLPDQVECAGRCDTCGRRMIRKRHPGPPPEGWARREGPGRCIGCYNTARNRRAAEARPPRSKAHQPELQTRAEELRDQGHTWTEVGAELGCSPQTARDAVRRAQGLPPRQRHRAPGDPARHVARCTDPQFQARVLAMLDDGMTVNETAARLGCGWHTVRRAHDHARPETPWTSPDRASHP